MKIKYVDRGRCLDEECDEYVQAMVTNKNCYIYCYRAKHFTETERSMSQLIERLEWIQENIDEAIKRMKLRRFSISHSADEEYPCDMCGNTYPKESLTYLRYSKLYCPICVEERKKYLLNVENRQEKIIKAKKEKKPYNFGKDVRNYAKAVLEYLKKKRYRYFSISSCHGISVNGNILSRRQLSLGFTFLKQQQKIIKNTKRRWKVLSYEFE